MPTVDGPATSIGGYRCKQSRACYAEAYFLAFHVAARLTSGCGTLQARFGQQWIARLLEVVADKHPDQKHDGECGEYRPALAGVAHHPAERIGQSRRNQKDQEHRQQVTQWSGVFVRMSGIGIEETAAVCAELLNRLLRGHRSLCDGLLCALNGSHLGIRIQVLNSAL